MLLQAAERSIPKANISANSPNLIFINSYLSESIKKFILIYRHNL
jgi:hypothetical protein